MSAMTFREISEKAAKGLGVKFEHLVGRTELYLNMDMVDGGIFHDLHAFGIDVRFVKRGRSLVAVLDYSSDVVFKQCKN